MDVRAGKENHSGTYEEAGHEDKRVGRKDRNQPLQMEESEQKPKRGNQV